MMDRIDLAIFVGRFGIIPIIIFAALAITTGIPAFTIASLVCVGIQLLAAALAYIWMKGEQ